jgi:hypothetical protein
MRQIYQDGRSLFYANTGKRLPSWEFFALGLPSEALATAEVFFDSGKVVTYELVSKPGEPPVAETLCELPGYKGCVLVHSDDGLNCARGIWYVLGPALALLALLWLWTACVQ